MNIKEFLENLKNDQGLIMLITLGVLLVLVCLNLITTFRSPKIISPQGTGQYALVDFSVLLKDYQYKTEQYVISLISIKQKDDLLAEAERNINEDRKTREEMQKQIDRNSGIEVYTQSLREKNEKLIAENTRLEKDNVYLNALLKRKKR